MSERNDGGRSEQPRCGARDRFSPRVCDRPAGHEGDHDDSTMSLGATERTPKADPDA